MKNFTKKLTLLVAALAASASIFPSSRAALALKGFLRPIAKLKTGFTFGVSRFDAQAAKSIAPHAFAIPVLNTVTVSPAYDKVVISQIAQFAANAAAKPIASNALVPVAKVTKSAYKAIPNLIQKFQLNAHEINLAAAGGNLVAFEAATRAYSPVSHALALIPVTGATQGIVTPLVVAGGCSPSFDIVPAQTAKTAYSAVSELLTRCKQNATGKNVAIASATIAAIAGASYFAYYMWSKPAATIVTAAVGTPVVKSTVPVVETSVVEAVAPIIETLVPEVVNLGEMASISEAAAKPSTYSYVSGLIGTAWAKAKLLVVPAVQKTITQANESKDNAAAAVVVGAITRKLQRLDAEIKAQAAEEDEKAAKEVVATPLVEAA